MVQNSLLSFSYIGIGRLCTIILHALFYFLFASFVDPEVYGELSVIVALASTFSTVSLFGLNLSLQVNLAKKNSELANKIITLFLITTAVFALILVTIDPLTALLSVSLSFFMMSQALLLGLKKYKKSMYYSILKSSIFSTIPILLYFVLDIQGIIIGMAISGLISGVPLYTKLKIHSLSGIKNYYKVLTHNFGVVSAFFLPNQLDKLLIAPLFGYFVVGVYTFNLQLLFVLSALPEVLHTYLISEESSGVKHRKLSYFIIIGSIILVTISIIIAPILIPIFYPKYTEGIESLQIMLISIIPLSVGAIFGSKLLAKESTKIGFTAIVRVGSILILIVSLGEYFGLIGLAFAVLISNSANTIFLYFLYQKEKQLKYG